MDSKSIQIMLYRLTKVNPIVTGEISRMIIASANEKQARETGNESSEDGGYYWTDGALVTCEELGTANDGVSGCLAIERV